VDRLCDATSALEFELDVSLRRNKSLANRSTALDEREKDLAEREMLVAERQREAAATQARAADEAAAARTSSLHAREAHLAAEHARQEAAAERDRLALNNQRLNSLPPFFERWLDRTTVAGQPIRKRFEADRIKMRSEIKAKLGPASTQIDEPGDALEL